MRVALLNPCSPFPVLRDYYCSTYPKARYLWQPVDLLALGAMLNERGAEVLLLDAVARRQGAEALREELLRWKPEVVFGLVSALTREEDLAFLESLSSFVPRLVVGGEVALDAAFDFGKHGKISGLVQDFTAPEAAEFLLGGAPSGRIRTSEHVPCAPPFRKGFRLGKVPHEALGFAEYRLPFDFSGFASLLTDFGCPFGCEFCNSGKDGIGFKLRDLDDIAAEVEDLVRLGVRKVYLRNMTFGSDRAHAREVLALLRPHGMRLRGFLRAELLDAEFCGDLRSAGFELGQLGIETPHEAERQRIGKNLKDARLATAARYLSEAKIALGAHFVVGFAGDTPQTVRQCLRLSRELDAAYCSLNLYRPRHGMAPLDQVGAAHLRSIARAATWGMLRYNGWRLLTGGRITRA